MLKSKSDSAKRKKKASAKKAEPEFTGRLKDKGRSPEEVANRKAQIAVYERTARRDHN